MTNVPGIWGRRKVRDGTVVSDKMEKTIVVAVQSNIRHPLYKKTIRRQKKYMAHDEQELAKLGDTVRIAEAAPTSKRKRWTLVEVLTRVELPEIAPEAIDSTLVEELAAPIAPPVTATAAESEAVEPVAVSDEVVQEDAGPEALETMEQTASAEAVAPEEPVVPPIDEEEPVQEDAGPGATEAKE
jgi:small subunit ribosomal protein S17